MVATADSSYTDNEIVVNTSVSTLLDNYTPVETGWKIVDPDYYGWENYYFPFFEQETYFPYFRVNYNLKLASGGLFAFEGDTLDFYLDGIYLGALYDIANDVVPLTSCESVQIRYIRGDGSIGYTIELPADVFQHDTSVTHDSDLYWVFSLADQDVTVPFDVYEIQLSVVFDIDKQYPNYDGYDWELFWNQGMIMGWDHPTASFSTVSAPPEQDNAGFFETIINGVQNIAQNIVDLPATIAEFIIDGITSIFVPSASDIENFKNAINGSIENNLGFIYQAHELVTDFWTDLKTNVDSVSTQHTLDMPELTVNLAGSDFTFGGYSVRVIPEGFEDLVVTLKSIVSIVCTLGFINSMVRKFDSVFH